MRTVEALQRLQAGDAAGALTMLAEAPDAASAGTLAARGMAWLANAQPALAEAAFTAAIAAGDGSAETGMNLALARAGRGDRAGAHALMKLLCRHYPDWDEPWVRLAELARAAGENDIAASAYEQALERVPRRVEALIGLGVIRLQAQQAVAAQKLLLRACGCDPERAEAWDALGLTLLLTDDAAAATAAFAEAHRLAPGHVDYVVHLAGAAVAARHVPAVLAQAELAAEADPLQPAAHLLVGLLRESAGDRDSAIDALEVALALAPEAEQLPGMLGSMLARAQRLNEALVMLRRAHQSAPDNPRITNDLAAVLLRMYRPAEARALLDDLRRDFPPQASVLCNLATATAACGEQSAAVAIAREAVALAPHEPLPWRTLIGALGYEDGTSAEELRAVGADCAARLARAPRPLLPNPDPLRRLRIGLLSGSLRTHPVGWLTIGGFETLDPAGFDLHCFTQNAGTDPLARRFRAIAASWHEIDAMPDDDAAQLIRDQRIDLLIDLGGYGERARMPICALRPAPVQIKWVGMQSHSTGMPEMDWFITDRWETPPELAPFYSERLLMMPDGYVCYSPPADAPEIGPLPALENGHITFGCLNNVAKLTPRTIALWSQILHACPTARLILRTQSFVEPALAEQTRARFAARGIDPARIATEGPARHREFLGSYNRIDLALDPLPYSGGLTTCEALWMGVPTIARPGEIFAARHSTSHLCNLGLDDWVAEDDSAYVALALRKADDLAALAALRAGLRARMQASPLCDAPRFGAHLGAALRHAWQTACAENA